MAKKAKKTVKAQKTGTKRKKTAKKSVAKKKLTSAKPAKAKKSSAAKTKVKASKPKRKFPASPKRSVTSTAAPRRQITKPMPEVTDQQANNPHPGMMGDGSEEQNLNQQGNPGERITQDDVDEAFKKPD
jgi:hypothetical protein